MKPNDENAGNLFESFVKTVASIIIIANLFYFIPFTIEIVWTSGGPMGFGLLVLPFFILINLLVIPALFACRKEIKNLSQKIFNRRSNSN